MQNTKTHDSKVGDTKMQEKGNQKSGSTPVSYQTPVAPEVISNKMASSDVAKHGDVVKHESQKDEYRMDPVKAETDVKNPSGITGQIKHVATAPADRQNYGSGSPIRQQPTVTPEVHSSVRGSRDTSKHVSEVSHESHKDEYRRDHVKTRTGMKNPVLGITSKTEPDAKTPATPVIT